LKIERLLYFEREKEKIKRTVWEIAEKIFKKEIKILTSIPGIGKESAIYFMSEIGSIERFSSAKKLIGFCGLDPVVKQTGKFKGRYKISKKGNSHARRIVWIMADCVRKYSSYFGNYYNKKRTEGKTYKEAVTATSTKLLRTIYALLTQNRLFTEVPFIHHSI